MVGRKRLSDAEKARRTQEKEDRAAQNRASAAVQRFPEDREKRLELFQERDALAHESNSISGKKSAQLKRMRELFGHHPKAMQIRDVMLKAKPGEREAIVAQVRLMLEDAGCEVQFDLFHSQPGVASEQDNGSVFDRGAAGERQGQEQFDPARAQKAAGEKALEPAAEGIPLDEAEKAFTENLAAAEAKKPKPGRKPKAERTPADDMREGTAEADAALKEQIAKSAKPARGRRPKAADTDAPDDPPPTAAAAPEIDDDLGELDDPPAGPLHANDPLPGATNHGDYRIAS